MTTNTLRPDGTVIAGNVAYTGGANWTAVTADDSDSTYATLQATGGSSATLDLTTFTLPAGNVMKQARIRARLRGDAGTATFQVGVDGWPLEASTPFLSGSATTTITTFTGAYVVASLSQTQIDGLQIRPSSLSAAARWVELYLDIVHAAQPTVTISTPTGTVTTSSPTTAFTYTQGSDGGPKTHHQIKVFTDAVFDGGGFDPDTSVDIYDSGEVASSATSVTFGPIADGTDHHLHVRVAQTINGVKHWSDWDEQIFTIDTNGPDIDTIAGVATNGSGLITVTVDRDTGGASWTAVTVERSEDSGTTWVPVRGATEATESNTFATFAADTFVVVDYEAPNGTSVVYRARGLDGTEVGAWSTNSSPVSWTSTSVWLKSVTDPTLNETITVLGLPDYALADTRTRTLTIQTSTANAASALEDLLGPIRRVGVFHVLGAAHPTTVSDAGDILLLQFPSTYGLDAACLTVTGYSRGFVAPLRGQTTANSAFRLFSVDTVEVARPPDTTSV